jgi:hypothetical protein
MERNREPQEGGIAYLIKPYKGYRAIKLLRLTSNLRWLAEIIESGLEIEVYDDEFELD